MPSVPALKTHTLQISSYKSALIAGSTTTRVIRVKLRQIRYHLSYNASVSNSIRNLAASSTPRPGKLRNTRKEFQSVANGLRISNIPSMWVWATPFWLRRLTLFLKLLHSTWSISLSLQLDLVSVQS